MGVESQDCRQIASLIGVKTFLNEFVAYDKLGKIIKNSNDYYNLVGMNNMTIANTTMDGLYNDQYSLNKCILISI